jgi:hypothetical protein
VGDSGNDSLVAHTGLDRLCGMDGDDTLWGGWDGDECLGAGGLLGTGTDSVNGCTDGSASDSDCGTLAFDAW